MPFFNGAEEEYVWREQEVALAAVFVVAVVTMFLGPDLAAVEGDDS